MRTSRQAFPWTQSQNLLNVAAITSTKHSKDATGCSVHEYHIRLRVETAKECIKHQESLTDAALTSGFSDQSHMTRLFKRVYGIMPESYQVEVSMA